MSVFALLLSRFRWYLIVLVLLNSDAMLFIDSMALPHVSCSPPCHFLSAFLKCYASLTGSHCSPTSSRTLVADFAPAYSIDTVILYFPYTPSTVNSYLIPRISTFYPFRPSHNPFRARDVYLRILPVNTHDMYKTPCQFDSRAGASQGRPCLPRPFTILFKSYYTNEWNFVTDKNKQQLGNETSRDNKGGIYMQRRTMGNQGVKVR